MVKGRRDKRAGDLEWPYSRMDGDFQNTRDVDLLKASSYINLYDRDRAGIIPLVLQTRKLVLIQTYDLAQGHDV